MKQFSSFKRDMNLRGHSCLIVDEINQIKSKIVLGREYLFLEAIHPTRIEKGTR